MSEEQGSAGGAGNPGSAPGQGGAPGQEGAPASTGQEGVPASTGQASWIDQVENPELKSWAETKGLHKGPVESVLKSYHNLEKIFGADKAGNTVILPGDNPKPEDLDSFYLKLGRPVDADGYPIAAPEGQPDDFAKWAKNTFFEANLTTKQAEILANKWEEFQGGIVKNQEDTRAETAAAATEALKKEWGAAYDAKVAGVNRAAEKLSITVDQLEGLKKSMGPADAMRFIDGLNSRIGEHSTEEEGRDAESTVMTPAKASEKLKNLGNDKDFMAAALNKSHPGHKDAIARKEALAKMAAGVAS